MSRKLSLRGKSVAVSDQDYDALAHLGAEIGIGLHNAIFASEAGKKLQAPSRGHAPRAVKEAAVEKKPTDAERLHSVVGKMRAMYRAKA